MREVALIDELFRVWNWMVRCVRAAFVGMVLASCGRRITYIDYPITYNHMWARSALPTCRVCERVLSRYTLIYLYRIIGL